MASLFGSLPSAGLRQHTRSGSGGATSLSCSSSSSSSSNVCGHGERTLHWVYDEETSNCMHCNVPFTLITRKVSAIYELLLMHLLTVSIYK
jgi:hypothetical protein